MAASDTQAVNADIVQKALDLIRAGKTAEADALLAKSANVPNAADAGKPKEPREVNAIVLDLFTGIHGLLGNNPAIVPLLNELKEAVEPPAAAASATKT